jgi:FAD/FMN-containing dehydrogenase
MINQAADLQDAQDLTSDDDASRVREAYGDDTYARLAVIKAKYEPENVFHNNKNIEPGQPAT